MSLTQDRLKELLDYNPETGLFVWKAGRRGSTLAGMPAGTETRNSYISICLDYRRYLAHRLAFLYMDGSMPPNEVDHINGSRADNRWANLRLASRLENMRNAKRRSDNASGITGVSWRKQKNTWRSFIYSNGKFLTIGSYGDFFEACCARKSAEISLGYHQNHGRT